MQSPPSTDAFFGDDVGRADPELAAILPTRVAGGATARAPTPAEWVTHEQLLASRYRDTAWHLTGTARSSPTGPTKEEAWTTACA